MSSKLSNMNEFHPNSLNFSRTFFEKRSCGGRLGAASGNLTAPMVKITPVRPQAALFQAPGGPNGWRCSKHVENNVFDLFRLEGMPNRLVPNIEYLKNLAHD